VNIVFSGDIAQLVRHTRAAGHAMHHAWCAFNDSAQHSFRAAHFPQHVYVHAAIPTGNFMRDLRQLNDSQTQTLCD
jgi:hypothetical protein